MMKILADWYYQFYFTNLLQNLLTWLSKRIIDKDIYLAFDKEAATAQQFEEASYE